jgi:hypothetical protein
MLSPNHTIFIAICAVGVLANAYVMVEAIRQRRYGAAARSAAYSSAVRPSAQSYISCWGSGNERAQ